MLVQGGLKTHEWTTTDHFTEGTTLCPKRAMFNLLKFVQILTDFLKVSPLVRAWNLLQNLNSVYHTLCCCTTTCNLPGSHNFTCHAPNTKYTCFNSVSNSIDRPILPYDWSGNWTTSAAEPKQLETVVETWLLIASRLVDAEILCVELNWVGESRLRRRSRTLNYDFLHEGLRHRMFDS